MECFNVSSLLAVTLNRPEEELSELLYTKSEENEGELTLKDDAYDVTLGLLQGKIKSIKDAEDLKRKKAVDVAQKEAYKDGLGKLEASIKDKYSLESDLLGIELVDELVQKFKVNDSKLTPDKIKLSETYMDREKELKKVISDTETTYQGKIDDIQAGFEKQQIMSVVSKDIRKALMALKPVLPKNETAAENQVELFINSFGEYDWQISSEGDHVPIIDGKRAEDSLSNPVQFKSLVEGRVPEYFDLYKQDPKGGAGNVTDPPGTGDTGDVPKTFASEQSYNDYLNSTTDSVKREQAYHNYKAQA